MPVVNECEAKAGVCAVRMPGRMIRMERELGEGRAGLLSAQRAGALEVVSG